MCDYIFPGKKNKNKRNDTHSNLNSAFLLLHVQHLLVTFGFYRSELTLTLVESTVKVDRESGDQLLVKNVLNELLVKNYPLFLSV